MYLYHMYIIFVVLIYNKRTINAELFSSVSAIEGLKFTVSEYSKFITGFLETSRGQLQSLENMYHIIENTERVFETSNSSKPLTTHPVYAFHIIHNLFKIQDKLKQFHGFHKIDCDDCTEVEIKDLIGSVEALIRLQVYYSINSNDILIGNLGKEPRQDRRYEKNANITGAILKVDDCYLIGRVAIRIQQYDVAVEWFQLALNMIQKNKIIDRQSVSISQVSIILEYLAFALYKMKRFNHATEIADKLAELTKGRREERILSVYRRRLNDVETLDESLQFDGDDGVQSILSVKSKRKISMKSNDDTKIEILTRDLCINRRIKSNRNSLYCYRQALIVKHRGQVYIGGYKIEVLNLRPQVIRVHEFLHNKESRTIRHLALPLLYRSTILNEAGRRSETESRIAKTAWLSKSSHDLVEKIETKIHHLLKLSMQFSEKLQVVNYGLGGFYGPHVDASKGSSSVSNYAHDRLATVLMYLSEPDLGGSTVFPKLNLSINAIENSAVVWYNLHKNGNNDMSTIHSSCPVLLGSKWIATKWVNEKANLFNRPCSLNKND